jgi:hypothetical protein
MATPTNLPSSFVAGAILTASQQNALRGAFRVLQVVTAEYSTETSAANSTYKATGLSCSITPQSNTNKILVIVNQTGCAKENNSRLSLRLMRSGNQLAVFESQGGWTNNGDFNNFGSCSTIFLDSPATAAPITYITEMRSQNNVATVYTQYSGAASSTITLMEISA